MKTLVVLFIIASTFSCSSNNDNTNSQDKASEQKVIKKKRDDGTLKSITQVDAENYAHGVKVNYYSNGKTVHSKITYNHGVKQGPAIYNYETGKVFEHTNFANGKREGTTSKYYKNGQLLSKCEFSKGEALPGLLEYAMDGTKVSDYPKVNFQKIDKLAFENKVILKISSTTRSRKVKYYHLLDMDNGKTFKSYLEVKAGVSTIEYHVAPGNVLIKTIELYAELPTKLGNTLVKKVSYQLSAKNR